MPDSDPFQITIGSDEFRQICSEMDCLLTDPNCTYVFDGMSGAFKFTDEFPQRLFHADHPLLFPAVGVLRYLWAYRISVVRGEPRSDLAPWWNAVKKLAPNWPGFLSLRCSPLMLSIVDEIEQKCKKFTKELDALNLKEQKGAD